MNHSQPISEDLYKPSHIKRCFYEGWLQWARWHLNNVLKALALSIVFSFSVWSATAPSAIIAPITLLLFEDDMTVVDSCDSVNLSLVKNFELDPLSLSYLENLTEFDDRLFFNANDGTNGVELWKSDGSAAGTEMVKDINPDPNVSAGTSNASGFTALDGALFFSAFNSTFGNELWKTDGSLAGTVMVKNIYTTQSGDLSASSVPRNFAEFNGSLLFSARDGTHGTELWTSDGTGAGTTMVKNIANGGGVFLNRSSNPQYFTEVNGELFFNADDGESGSELWKTDGSNTGTVLVKNIRPDVNLPQSTSPSFPRYLTESNGVLYFFANDGTNGIELWKSEGTEASTMLVKNIKSAPGAGQSSTQNPNFTEVNGTLFFVADDGVSGSELWKTDGTAAGTVTVKNINASFGSNPAQLTEFDGRLYFTANDGTNGRELWKSDGTAASTVMVADIGQGNSNTSLDYLTEFKGKLFFAANGASGGRVLWETDGTAANTIKVTTTLGFNYSPSRLTVANETLFFRIDDPVNGIELWKGTCQ